MHPTDKQSAKGKTLMRGWRLYLLITTVALGCVPTQAAVHGQASPPLSTPPQVPGEISARAPAISGLVVDQSGAAISGAHILAPDGRQIAVTDDAGQFHATASDLPVTDTSRVKPGATPGTKTLQVEARGFRTATVTFSAGETVRVVMRVESQADAITVTAYRTPLASIDSPASTRILTREALDESASPALDNKLRLVPGVELFRRSSSLVANPTSQGLSLRGLGSTAASRTLVVSDDVPLNDPYGGWIHWTEPPELSIRSVELVRGGASDLYGSSAIGGVVNLLAERPGRNRLVLLSSYGGENTADESILASATRQRWSGLVSGGILRTDGYRLVAPNLRGPVDIPSNVHSQNGVIEADRSIFADSRLFMRFSGFNEARSNGTPLQTNATRLWRYSAGADLPIPALFNLSRSEGQSGGQAGARSGNQSGTITLRLYGSEEHYRQSFSAIAAGRATESQTRFEHTPAQELGAVAIWTQPLRATLLAVAGADTHDVRATDTEQSVKGGKPAGLLDTTARQRQTGVYGEVLWTPHAWTLSAGGRVDHFSNFDARQSSTSQAPAALPSLAETVFDPRVGVARHVLPRLTPNLVWSASAFRAYRAPTQNELYRTGQVGQETTQPNDQLRSERATGWETGVHTSIDKTDKTTLRVSYFWTQVNRPITALTVSTTPTQILEKRENLGQIESRGISLDFESEPVRWLALTGGYQYANATVTRFTPGAALVGNWIPQVARNTASAQLRLSGGSLGTLSLQGRVSGRQYDDAGNNFLLHSYFRLDAYASHNFGSHLEVFAAGENLFDRAIQVGRTPTLTLGAPAQARAGLRLRFGD